MSFNTFKKVVEEGDTVMLYLGKQSMLSLVVDSSKTHQTKFGAFPHQDFIGKLFGTKVYSKKGRGFVYLMHPTPELWTVTLPHRTQILYSTDISLITMELDLRPGSIVVESGTGSGSLSHAIVRTIKPTGHLHTFDFHEQRVRKAREEFEQHGIGQYITSKCADACKDGFGLEDVADAVFLDLPAPWDAIPHAKKALKKSGGRLCTFSPCIEQVQRTCVILRKLGFCEIKTIECLLRTMNIRTTPLPEVTTNIGLEKIKEVKAEEQNDDIEPMKKLIKREENDDPSEKQENTTEGKKENFNKITGLLPNGMVSKLTAQTRSGHINVLTSKPIQHTPGHTGYLTFASLYPSSFENTDPP